MLSWVGAHLVLITRPLARELLPEKVENVSTSAFVTSWHVPRYLPR